MANNNISANIIEKYAYRNELIKIEDSNSISSSIGSMKSYSVFFGSICKKEKKSNS